MSCGAAMVLLCLPPWLFAQSLPHPSDNSTSPTLVAAPWPEADRLFRSDPRWLGGDAAFSIDLGQGRVLWSFGDSFIAPHAGATRRQSAFVRNSVAIQTGYDPAHASIQFYSNHRHGQPADFMTAEAGHCHWLWPLHGIRLGPRLLLFYMVQAPDPDKNSLGFQSAGWRAFLVDNPEAEPSRWRPRALAVPEPRGKMLAGMAVLRDGNYLYAYVLNDTNHDAYLLRWPVAEAEAGHLLAPQWWCGDGLPWQADSSHRQVIIRNAGGEFSVQRAPRGDGFLEVNSVGFGATSIVMRHAPRLEGPWSAPQTLYRPLESDEPGTLVYAGKSHPELTGADLILTYAANADDQRLATDMSIYFPRFVRVTLSPLQNGTRTQAYDR